MSKDAIDGSALLLYRKAERERAVRPLFLSAPPSEANESVRPFFDQGREGGACHFS